MSTQQVIGYGHRHRQSLRTYGEDSAEIKQRFRDVKADLRERSDFEVTNGYVLSVLFDLYWLHHEDGGEV